MELQLALALVIVAIAVAFLGRHAWQRARRRPGAGACGGCAAAGTCGAAAPQPPASLRVVSRPNNGGPRSGMS